MNIIEETNYFKIQEGYCLIMSKVIFRQKIKR